MKKVFLFVLFVTLLSPFCKSQSLDGTYVVDMDMATFKEKVYDKAVDDGLVALMFLLSGIHSEYDMYNHFTMQISGNDISFPYDEKEKGTITAVSQNEFTATVINEEIKYQYFVKDGKLRIINGDLCWIRVE